MAVLSGGRLNIKMSCQYRNPHAQEIFLLRRSPGQQNTRIDYSQTVCIVQSEHILNSEQEPANVTKNVLPTLQHHKLNCDVISTHCGLVTP